MDSNYKQFQIKQKDKNFILTTEIDENFVRIICLEDNNDNLQMFIRDFSLNDFRKLNKIFNSTITIQDAQKIINQSIQQKKLAIKYNNDSINLLLFLQNQKEMIILSLKSHSNKPFEITYTPQRFIPGRKSYLPPVENNSPSFYGNQKEENMNGIQQNNNPYLSDMSKKDNLISINNPKEEINNISFEQDKKNPPINQINNINSSSKAQQNEVYNRSPRNSIKKELLKQLKHTNESTSNQDKINYPVTNSNKNNLNQPNNQLNFIPNGGPESITSYNYNNIDNSKIIELENEANKIKGEHELLKSETYKYISQIEQLNKQIQILNEENINLKQNKGVIINGKEMTILKQQLERMSKELIDYKRINNKQIEELKNAVHILQIENNDLKLQIELLKNNNNNIYQSQNYIISKNSYEDLMKDNLEIINGELIENNDELEFLIRKIGQNNNKQIILTILYKATVDSDKAAAFHNKCDWAKSNIVIIKSGNGKRFGGFTSCNWSGNSIDKKDDNAFIFSLDKMKIYDIIPGEKAIGCYPNYGPVFLGGQIIIYDNSFTKGGSTFLKGFNYNTQEDFELTDGLQKFAVKEIEVYNVEFI